MNNKRRNEDPIHDKKHLQMEREEPIRKTCWIKKFLRAQCRAISQGCPLKEGSRGMGWFQYHSLIHQMLGQLQIISRGCRGARGAVTEGNQPAVLLVASSSQRRSNWVSPKLAHNPFIHCKHARVPSRCLWNCYPLLSPYCQLHTKVMFTPHLESRSWVYTNK